MDISFPDYTILALIHHYKGGEVFNRVTHLDANRVWTIKNNFYNI